MGGGLSPLRNGLQDDDDNRWIGGECCSRPSLALQKGPPISALNLQIVDLVFIREDRGPGRGTYGLRRDRTHPWGDAGHDRKSLGPAHCSTTSRKVL